MAHRSVAGATGAAILLLAHGALADRVAVVPSRGGDAAARAALEADVASGLQALGHTLVSSADTSAAITAQVKDGVADTLSEYSAVGAATRADWVIVATIALGETPKPPPPAIELAVTGARVELTACFVRAARVETVAREIERANERTQTREMLAVLLRAKGIGTGPLPWERGGTPQTPIPGSEGPCHGGIPCRGPAIQAVEGRARLIYPASDAREAWPPYSGGNRGFLSAVMGGSFPVVRPALPPNIATNAAEFVGGLRGGYAVGDLGLELFADFAGNLHGTRDLWVDGGLRWMFAPALRRDVDGVRAGAPFFLGPEITGGAFIELPATAPGFSAPAAVRGQLGGALDLAFALAPHFSLEARLGNLRWVPGGSGALLFMGADVGATARF